MHVRKVLSKVTRSVPGFTLVELSVSMGIMLVIMGITLTGAGPQSLARLKLADDVFKSELLMREIQIQGSSINSIDELYGGAGMYFNLATNTQILRFKDSVDPNIVRVIGVGDGLYRQSPADEKVDSINLSPRVTLAKLCVATTSPSIFYCNGDNVPPVDTLTISFSRPSQYANIYINGATSSQYMYTTACVQYEMPLAPLPGYVRSLLIYNSGMVSKRMVLATNTKNKKYKYTYQAFTLVEILVVLGLFSSIAVLSLGSLFNVQAVNVKLQESQTILDNLNFSTQTIIRDIKFGSDFHATTTVPAPVVAVPSKRRNCSSTGAEVCNVIVFKSIDSANPSDRVAYYVNNFVLYKNVYPSSGIMRTLQMTSNEVEIKSFNVYVEGALTSDPFDGLNEGALSDLQQPLITITLSGVTKTSRQSFKPTEFTIQTSVSARELDTK